MLRAQAGDREALDVLLASVQSRLYHYILSLVREPALAEDALQETFLRMYRKLHWLREPKLFRSWAYRIATHEAFRLLKRQLRWTAQMDDEALLANLPAAPPREDVTDEWAAQLPGMIAALSPASRAVIGLYYLHERSLEEVATILEIPVGTVKSRLAYGLNQLRKQVRGKA